MASDNNGWISVNDQLPELINASVLVYFKRRRCMDVVYIADYFGNITDGFDEKGNQMYTQFYKIQGITHWQRLPEEPTK